MENPLQAFLDQLEAIRKELIEANQYRALENLKAQAEFEGLKAMVLSHISSQTGADSDDLNNELNHLIEGSILRNYSKIKRSLPNLDEETIDHYLGLK